MNWPAYVFLTFTVGVLAGAYYALTLRPKARTDEEWNQVCVERQKEAYEIGLTQGRAAGELFGQTRAMDVLAAQIREKDAMYGELTIEDVERARRGLIH